MQIGFERKQVCYALSFFVTYEIGEHPKLNTRTKNQAHSGRKMFFEAYRWEGCKRWIPKEPHM